MQVQRIETKRVEVECDVGSNIGRNRVDIITGPNGSGKTEVLARPAATVGLGVAVASTLALQLQMFRPLGMRARL